MGALSKGVGARLVPETLNLGPCTSKLQRRELCALPGGGLFAHGWSANANFGQESCMRRVRGVNV